MEPWPRRSSRALDLASHPEDTLLAQACERDLRCFRSAQWLTDGAIEDVEGDVLCRVAYEQSDGVRLVLEVEVGIAFISLERHSVVAVVAAQSDAAAETGLEAIRTALPRLESDDRTVPALFWWQDNSARHSVRRVPTLEWAEIEANYRGEAHASLTEMLGWHGPPPGGRLIVWHGEPGTGKTTAIRQLAGAWREWSEFHFITDPENFLRSSSYLLEVVASGQPASPRSRLATPSHEHDPWRVIVLEDSGEYLAPDAKHEQGQAISRLLNVCDGILGEAMKVVVLLTTNEPIRRLGPALTRPGRLLRSTEFERFDARAAAEWLEARELPTAAVDGADSLSLADLYAIAERRERPVQPGRDPVGFAA